MLYRVLSLFFTVGLLITVSAFSQQVQPNSKPLADDGMIEIGAGAMNTTKEIEALFRIDGKGLIKNKDGSYYVIVRMRSDMSFGNKISYADIHVDGAGFGQSYEDLFSKSYWDVTFVNLDIQRNLTLDLDRQMRITFLGLHGGYENEVTDDIKFLINGAADFIGFGFSEKASNNSGTNGAGMGLSLEAGFKFSEKYKVTFSHKSDFTESDPVRYYNGIACSTYSSGYYDNWYGDPYYGTGWTQTYCGPSYSTEYTQHRRVSTTSLNLTAQITKHLMAFGKASYSVYRVRSDLGQVSNSYDSGLQFLWGVSYKF